MGRERGLLWALDDIMTAANFGIAMIAALIATGSSTFVEIDCDLSSFRPMEQRHDRAVSSAIA
jgi:hypothetical protein